MLRIPFYCFTYHDTWSESELALRSDHVACSCVDLNTSFQRYKSKYGHKYTPHGIYVCFRLLGVFMNSCD